MAEKTCLFVKTWVKKIQMSRFINSDRDSDSDSDSEAESKSDTELMDSE